MATTTSHSCPTRRTHPSLDARPGRSMQHRVQAVVASVGLSLLAMLTTNLGACSAQSTQPTDRTEHAVQATEPATDKADGTDLADHGCQIVLRSVTRTRDANGQYAETCDADGCHWAWEATIDVATELVRQGASPALLYHRTTDPTWWETPADPIGVGDAGFTRYRVLLAEHVAGPGDSDDMECIPVLHENGGIRLFDHNIVERDFDNYRLESNQGYNLWPRGGICTHRPDTAALVFMAHWVQFVERNDLRAGGRVAIEYDPSRLPDCRATHDGFPAWGIEATIQFLPGGQMETGPVVAFKNDHGRPIDESYPIPFEVAVPEDATEAVLWFHNASGAGNFCDAWDSNYGRNYHFDVKPPRGQDPCAGSLHWLADSQRTEAWCPSYRIDDNVDATHCEFYLNAIDEMLKSHYGIPEYWIEANLAVGPQDGQVLAAGMYVDYFDRGDATQKQAWIEGNEDMPGHWKTGFQYVTTMSPPSGSELDRIDAFAFFLDVHRPNGKVHRLWLSRGGANYHWEDAFGLPTTREYISYGHEEHANQSAPVYDSKWACQ
ncbi:MAG: hypothetical protein J7M25_05620 [Deltaproteobacteria bacterium]|nr:hypothetical protein [Deltaproteobacteria bacterium]